MNGDFPRIITLLRKERGLSQKNAAADLGVSQALLSHYEKGIRECGLDFLVKCADYYNVSCDYLLGRSPERTGVTLHVEDIPEPDANGKDNVLKGSVLTTLNKKLIANSLNILFDLLAKSNNKVLLAEASDYLFICVYTMFRMLFSANDKNKDELFTLPSNLYSDYASSSMLISKAKLAALISSSDNEINFEALHMSTTSLSQNYPLFASSLFNLIKNAEEKIGKLEG